MDNYFSIIEDIISILKEGECIDADGYRQLTLPYAGNPNDGVDFRPIVKAYKNKKANEKRQATRAANKEKREIEAAQKANTPINSLGLKITEEIINEISDELANKVHDIRLNNVNKAENKEDFVKATNKFNNNFELMKKRDHRKEEKKKALQKFRDFYKDRVVTAKDTKEAGEEHDNAQINQGLRNKLEKIYAMESFSDKELFSLMEELINETSEYFRTVKKQAAAKKVLPQRQQKALDSVRLAMHMINKIHGNVEQGKDIPNSLVKTASTAAKNADIAQKRANDAEKVVKG